MIKKLYEEPVMSSLYNNIHSPLTVQRIVERSKSVEEEFIDLSCSDDENFRAADFNIT